MVEELCETFSKKVDAAKEEVDQERKAKEETQADRDRNVERGKEHAALVGKQVQTLKVLWVILTPTISGHWNL